MLLCCWSTYHKGSPGEKRGGGEVNSVLGQIYQIPKMGGLPISVTKGGNLTKTENAQKALKCILIETFFFSNLFFSQGGFPIRDLRSHHINVALKLHSKESKYISKAKLCVLSIKTLSKTTSFQCSAEYIASHPRPPGTNLCVSTILRRVSP